MTKRAVVNAGTMPATYFDSALAEKRPQQIRKRMPVPACASLRVSAGATPCTLRRFLMKPRNAATINTVTPNATKSLNNAVIACRCAIWRGTELTLLRIMKSSDLTGLQMKMLNAICRMVKVKWTNRATTTSLLVSPSHQSRPSSVDLLVSQMVKLRDVPTSTNSAPTSMLNRFFASVASVVPPKQREAISGGAVRVRQLWLTGWHWCANKTWVVAITGVVLLLPLQIGAALEQGPPAQPH